MRFLVTGSFLLSFVMAGSIVSPTPPAVAQSQSPDSARAAQLYREVMSGRRKVESLSPEELNAVLAIHRRLRRSTVTGGKPACRDAMERAESAAEDVASRGRRLISCVQNEDHRDDCSSEFRRLRSAHSDYESAVSEVQSECD